LNVCVVCNARAAHVKRLRGQRGAVAVRVPIVGRRRAAAVQTRPGDTPEIPSMGLAAHIPVRRRSPGRVCTSTAHRLRATVARSAAGASRLRAYRVGMALALAPLAIRAALPRPLAEWGGDKRDGAGVRCAARGWHRAVEVWPRTGVPETVGARGCAPPSPRDGVLRVSGTPVRGRASTAAQEERLASFVKAR